MKVRLSRSLVLAGDVLFLAGHLRDKETSFVHAYSVKDGSKLRQWPLASRPLRHGMAAAGGRLFVSLESGELISFAP